MNILIVDGNEKAASEKYTSLGMDTQYEVYSKIINKLSNNQFNVSIAHPAFKSNYLPKGISLDDFDGIVWTGSLLNIYDFNPAITNQIELAKNLFTKKNKIFGSCWGLHVLVTAAGGKIRKNPKGLEAVVAENIQINQEGLSHKLYKDKKKGWLVYDVEVLGVSIVQTYRSQFSGYLKKKSMGDLMERLRSNKDLGS